MVAIIPEGEAGYFVQELINGHRRAAARYRTVHNLRGPDGLGGLVDGRPRSRWPQSCPNKLAAWEVLKFLTGDPDVESYYFTEGGDLPTIKGGIGVDQSLSVLPDEEIIVTEPGFTEPRYPWAASDPRWSLQAALQGPSPGR